jgi:hypothetical protein
MTEFLEKHSAELTVLILSALILGSLLLLVPQLLRAHQHTLEMAHEQHMRAVEHGRALHHLDERSLFAGRIALLVPMVATCTAGTVTCFLVAYRAEMIFSVSLAAWSVAGVVSLAAITGGVALLGRLAQLHTEEEEQEVRESVGKVNPP